LIRILLIQLDQSADKIPSGRVFACGGSRGDLLDPAFELPVLQKPAEALRLLPAKSFVQSIAPVFSTSVHEPENRSFFELSLHTKCSFHPTLKDATVGADIVSRAANENLTKSANRTKIQMVFGISFEIFT
jgi:hypothetical protein